MVDENNRLTYYEYTNLTNDPGESDKHYEGRGGDDYLRTGDGNDTLDGGTGNDLLDGGNGDDVYLFSPGFGQDRISSISLRDATNRIYRDRISFSAGITRDDLSFAQVGDDLVISVKDSEDQITIAQWYVDGAVPDYYARKNDVTEIIFADGDRLSWEEINYGTAPQVSGSIVDQAAKEHEPFQLALPNTLFVDEDAGDRLSLSASLLNGSPLPEWLSLDASNFLAGTPGASDGGDYAIKITATDRSGQSVSTDFVLHVESVNDAPVLASANPDQQATIGDLFTYQVPADSFSDPDPGDVLNYSCTLDDGSSLPGWLTFDASTLTLSGTPDTGSAGALGVRLIAEDSSGLSVYDDFVLSVAEAPQSTDPDPADYQQQITGTDSGEQLLGRNSADLIEGLGGDDQVFGFSGDDWLSGGAGNDYLSGGNGSNDPADGNDTLIGGEGDDTLFGEFGRSAWNFCLRGADDILVLLPLV